MSSLICPEQTCVMKYRTIQDIHLVHLIIVDSEVIFFNWDQSRAFDKVDHKFLKACSFFSLDLTLICNSLCTGGGE